MLNKVRYGILGFGKHASKMLTALGGCDLSKLHALASESGKFTTSVFSNQPQVKIYSTYENLISDSEVDVVYICLPNNLHAPWIEKSLRAGKHVLSEKPLVLTAADASRLINLARKKSLCLAEAFMYRFHPQHIRVKELINSGHCGEIKLFRANFQYDLFDKTNIRLRPECGGGALNDVGCYLIDSLSYILGRRPLSVSGQWSVDERFGVDTFCTMDFQLENGSATSATAQLCCSTELPREHSYTIFGTEAIVRLKTAYRVNHTQNTTIEIQDRTGKIRHENIPAFNQYAKQFDRFSEWVMGDNSAEHDFSDPVKNAYLIDKVRQACSSKTHILLD